MSREVKHLQLEYAPDANPEAAGIILDCTSIIPGTNGYRGALGTTRVTDSLVGTPVNAVVIRLLDDTFRTFAGTTTKLYELTSGSSWADVSKGAGTYTTTTNWRFAQFGNDTIATNRLDAVQVSTSTGAFADLGGSPPKAAIAAVCNGFAFLFDYNDGVNDYGDGWWCSALRNDASWSPSIATQAANGRLVDSPGRIRGAKDLGNLMVAYKERSMYVGYYDGAPVIWRWELLPGQIGAISQEAIVSTGTSHIFAGYDDFYLFDGSRPVSIGFGKVRDFWNDNCNPKYKYKTVAQHDILNGIVYFRYVSIDSPNGIIDKCLVYNYRVNKWGRDDRVISAVIEYVGTGITYDNLGSSYSTYDTLPTITYDSPYWIASSYLMGYFPYSTNTISIITSGYTASGLIKFGWLGDEQHYSTLSRIRLRFSNDVATALTDLYADHNTTEIIGYNSPTLSETQTANSNFRKIDFDVSSLWHQIVLYPTWIREFELTGITYYFEDDGEQ